MVDSKTRKAVLGESAESAESPAIEGAVVTETTTAIPAQTMRNDATAPANALSRKALELAKTNTDRGPSFLDLLDEVTDIKMSRTVVPAEDMVGIPFIITGVKFHEGKGGFFVSLEAVTADAGTLNEYLNRGRIKDRRGNVYPTLANLPVLPDMEIVINDSGTGIRRQMVQWLYEVKGLIAIDEAWDFAAADKKSVFDQPFTKWKSGQEAAMAGFTGLRYLAPKGTTISDYAYQGDLASTAYIA